MSGSTRLASAVALVAVAVCASASGQARGEAASDVRAAAPLEGVRRARRRGAPREAGRVGQPASRLARPGRRSRAQPASSIRSCARRRHRGSRSRTPARTTSRSRGRSASTAPAAWRSTSPTGARSSRSVPPGGSSRSASEAPGASDSARCLARLETPRLWGGFLPILETRYVDARGVRYVQESFAARIPETRSLVSFVRLTATRPRTRRDDVRFTPSGPRLAADGNRLRLGEDTYLVFGAGGESTAPRSSSSCRPASAHGLRRVAELTRAERSLTLDEETYEAARRSLAGTGSAGSPTA